MGLLDDQAGVPLGPRYDARAVGLISTTVPDTFSARDSFSARPRSNFQLGLPPKAPVYRQEPTGEFTTPDRSNGRRVLNPTAAHGTATPPKRLTHPASPRDRSKLKRGLTPRAPRAIIAVEQVGESGGEVGDALGPGEAEDRTSSARVDSVWCFARCARATCAGDREPRSSRWPLSTPYLPRQGNGAERRWTVGGMFGSAVRESPPRVSPVLRGIGLSASRGRLIPVDGTRFAWMKIQQSRSHPRLPRGGHRDEADRRGRRTGLPGQAGRVGRRGFGTCGAAIPRRERKTTARPQSAGWEMPQA